MRKTIYNAILIGLAFFLCVFNINITVDAEDDYEQTEEPVTETDKDDYEIDDQIINAVQADSIYTDESNVLLKSFTSKQLTYKLYPDGSEDTVTWHMSYASGVSLSNDGMITSYSSSGYASVYAEISNGSTCSYDINVYSEPESVSFSESKYVIFMGSSKWVEAHGEPYEAYSCPLTYAVEDTSIAEINGQYVYAKKAGKTKVTATAENGASATAEIEVLDGDYADYIVGIGNHIKVEVDQSVQLEYTLGSYSDPGKTDFNDEKVT